MVHTMPDRANALLLAARETADAAERFVRRARGPFARALVANAEKDLVDLYVALGQALNAFAEQNCTAQIERDAEVTARGS
jgi:hypothetical protein